MKPVDWGHYSAQKRWKWAVLEKQNDVNIRGFYCSFVYLAQNKGVTRGGVNEQSCRSRGGRGWRVYGCTSARLIHQSIWYRLHCSTFYTGAVWSAKTYMWISQKMSLNILLILILHYKISDIN